MSCSASYWVSTVRIDIRSHESSGKVAIVNEVLKVLNIEWLQYGGTR
jgi:hypothetical protein